MASFISALSLFLLILSNGCFTSPIIDKQLSSPTFSSLYDDLTTEPTFNLRLVPNDETSVLPDIDKKRSIDEHMGFPISTEVDGLSEEKAARALRIFDEFSTSEPMTFTTEQSIPDKRDHDDLSFTTIKPITQVTKLKQRSFLSELENKTENDKREMQVELTTNDMLLFTSTSSAVAPELYKSESSISTSTEKYPDLIQNEQTTKYMKTPKSEVTLTKQKSEEESTVPTTLFDQEALNKISNVSNDLTILDENNDIVVTGLPDNISTFIMKNIKEEKILNQGKESSHSEEKESNHWNGSSFGWTLSTFSSSIFISTSWKIIN